MKDEKIKIGKKGGLKRVVKMINDIRNQSLPREVFEIVDRYYESSIKKKTRRRQRGSLP